MDLRQTTAQKVQQLISAANGPIPQGAVTSKLTFDEQSLANRERWLVPNYENPGFFDRGPATALANMESFMALGPNPLYPSAKKTGPGEAKDRAIGSDTVVVDNGKTYKAKVKEKRPDGSYKLSFAGERPSRDTYSDRELGDEDEKQGTPAAEKASDSSFKYNRF